MWPSNQIKEREKGVFFFNKDLFFEVSRCSFSSEPAKLVVVVVVVVAVVTDDLAF
uniref:Uncharacterized protein n=1 Tax=Oryza brachyantha TaxID=4533 RepID=J3N669_ORYBR